MCVICVKILGPHCKPHEESACPLQKAMHCSLCGKGKHFTKNCPLRSGANKTEEIPSIKPEAQRTYLLSHKIDVYIEYLRVNGQDFGPTLIKNRELVQNHLLTRGYVLVNPYTSCNTPLCTCSRCKKAPQVPVF
jgi:hypothetical protein